MANLKKVVIDKRLVNSVKYHCLHVRKFENKCKNKHKVQKKLSKVQTCTTDLIDSYSLTQWQFWQLTLKVLRWLSGARAQELKTNNTILLFSFFIIIFIQLCDSRKIHYLTREFQVKLHLKTDIGIPSSGNEFSYRVLLDVLFVSSGFLKRLFMPWHLHSWHFETSSPSWNWDVRKVAMAIL